MSGVINHKSYSPDVGVKALPPGSRLAIKPWSGVKSGKKLVALNWFPVSKFLRIAKAKKCMKTVVTANQWNKAYTLGVPKGHKVRFIEQKGNRGV